MEILKKTNEEIRFVSNIDVSLANAIRRSVNEIPIIAIDEADIYKNDTVLYDEVLSHRLGLIPLKNQKLKEGQTVEFKLKAKGKEGKKEILSGELGPDVVYSDMPVVLLEEGQEVEIVGRARAGRGVEHTKFSPGVIFYKHLPKIKISGNGEKQTELAEIYPETFEVYGEKLRVKDASEADIDLEDFENYEGISVEFKDDLVFSIESWGQINAKEIFVEACKVLKSNLNEISKAIK